MKEKIIAITSITFMLFAASAALFDRLLIAYAITLIYAVIRWKLSEQRHIIVKNESLKWLLRIFIIICCVIFAAGGGFFGTALQKINPLLQGISSIIGFAFAYDIGRYFNKITLSTNTQQ